MMGSVHPLIAASTMFAHAVVAITGNPPVAQGPGVTIREEGRSGTCSQEVATSPEQSNSNMTWIRILFL